MQIIQSPIEMSRLAQQWHSQGQRIAFVPTMGNLHAGHLALVQQAKTQADRVVVSIFVNPLQFGKNEDFSVYPRTPEEDTAALQAQDVEVLFMPSVQAMYPRKQESMTFVEVPGLSQIFCGASRPGHFRGVATVVNKLFNIVQPDVAVFGEKDFQQLLVIRRMVEDLALAVQIVGVETLREPDGLAMSSRNRYLDASARAKAPALYQQLQNLAIQLSEGEHDFTGLENTAHAELIKAGFDVDYVRIVSNSDLSEPQDSQHWVILAAVWLAGTRLIDNIKV